MNTYIVDIIRENDEGLGIAKISDITVFVKNAIIGEKVVIEVTEKKKNYWIAEAIKILEKSEFRVEPSCKFYSICGGCNIMHMCYEKQLDFKVNRVKHIFKKLYNKDINISTNDIVGISPFNYRNKVVLRVENKKIGFYRENTNDLFNCDKCIISKENINKIISILSNFINKNNNHNISEIMIRENSNDNIMICIDNINNKLKTKLISELSNSKLISSIYISNNLEYGQSELTINMFDLSFKVSPKSFFQVNYQVTKELYKYILDNIDIKSNVLDLYCGTGTITSIISRKCKNVIGVEVVKDAVIDAKKSTKENKISNVKFINSKVENIIEKIQDDIDIIVMDPARSGSDIKTLKTICKIMPKKIIYVSCNPITLVRDLKELDKYYDIENIKLFDMFPNTYHVETICVLKKL